MKRHSKISLYVAIIRSHHISQIASFISVKKTGVRQKSKGSEHPDEKNRMRK